MSCIKKLLLYSLGEKRYLRLLASSFQRLYKTGRLGVDYQDIYFLKNLVKPGDYCIDIGAHLGYFTIELSRICGNNGQVYAIEPMSKFYNTLLTIVQSKELKNITLYPYAMGGDTPFVEMGIPRVNNTKKFAYARVMRSSTFLEYVESEQVKNVYGDELFRELPRLDFIKCDVEGLELSVMQSFLGVIRKHQPVILCELSDPRDRKNLLDLLSPFAYRLYYLENRKLKTLSIDSAVAPVSHNHYFIPDNRIESLAHLLI
ncbi:MAG TPA: FkbM family methyltransferase [Puia sp.]